MKKISKPFTILISLFALILSACGGGSVEPSGPNQSQTQNAPAILDEITVEEVQNLIGRPDAFEDIDPSQTEIQLPGAVSLITVEGSYSICKLGFDTIKGAYSIGVSCAGVRVDLGTIIPTIVTVNLIAQGTVSTVLVPEGLIATGSIINIAQVGTGVTLLAAVATTISAATSSAIQAAPCIPPEQLQAFLAATDPNGPKPRICSEKATIEELPQACKDHHINHDDTPDNPEAQARWKTACDASKAPQGWGPETQDWSSPQTEKGQWRCSQTEVNINGNWKVVRFAASNSTKVTATNAYGDMTIVDIFSNQITSFPLARWRDLIKSANDLIESYGVENVRTYPINCYDLRQYGVTIKSSLNGDQATRPNQAAVCTQQ